MSNELALPQSFGAVDHLAGRYANVPADRLGEGVSSGYSIIGYKGKRWSIRHGQEEEILMREDGDGPRNSIEVVVVKAAAGLQRTWYERGYVEGSTEPPDCTSNNGVTPTQSSPKKQSNSCATCIRNQFKLMPNGKQGKECANAKRLAVVMGDQPISTPMLLRVPGASLTPMKVFGDRMASLGFPHYFTYVVRISFDSAESYPKFVFKEVRPLSREELDMVDELRTDPDINRILAEDERAPLAAAPEQGKLEWENPNYNQQKAKSAPTIGGASTPPAQTAATSSQASTQRTARASSGRTGKTQSDGSAPTAASITDLTSQTSKPSEASPSPSSTNEINLDEELDALMGAE